MFTAVMMIMTPDYSTGSHDDAFAQTPEVVDKVQHLPIQLSPPLPPPHSNPERCPNKPGYEHSLQRSASVSVYMQDSSGESNSRQPRLGVYVTIAILAFAVAIGMYWSYENLVQMTGSTPVSEVRTAYEKKFALNQSKSAITADKPTQDLKAETVTHSAVQNELARSEKRLVDSQSSFTPSSSNIELITDRLIRLDEEFSRLKIDIVDWKNTEELRKQNAIRSTNWTKAISSGQLMILTNSDDRNMNSLPLVFVPAGQFWMGQTAAQRVESARASSAAHYDFSHPAYSVQVKSGYFIGMFEVTVGQMQEFASQSNVGETITAAHRYPNDADRNKPACNIDWKTAMAFCDWLSMINNIEVRLPTEVEWEYAARGNMYVQSFESTREQNVVVGGPWPVDNQILDRSWCGCVAMNSNVQEWTIDIWDEKAYERRDVILKSSRPNSSYIYKGAEPIVANSTSDPRAVRGSSFQDIPANRVLAIRRFKPINTKEETLGFRIVVPVVNEELTTGK